MFKNFYWFIKYYKKRYILGLFFLLLADVIGLIPPYITGKLTDLIYKNEIELKLFFIIIGIYIISVVLKYCFAILWGYFLFRGSDEIDFILKNKLMKKILRQSLKFFETHSTGALISKSSEDTTSINEFAGYGALTFFDATIIPFFTILIMIFFVDFKLTILSILPLPFLAITVLKIGNKLMLRYESVQKAKDDLNTTTLEDIEAIRVIKVFNNYDHRFDIFKRHATNVKDLTISYQKYVALLQLISIVITSLSFVIAIFYGSILISNKVISLGKLVSFVYYLNTLVWPMYAIGDFINSYKSAIASMKRIDEVLDYKEDVFDSSDKESLSFIDNIEFKNYNFKYPTSKENVLKDINLKIEKGKSLGILGKTGSGKTTLIKQLFNFYPFTDNGIFINGCDFNNYSLISIRDKISYVPQNHMIFSKTVKENILFANSDASEEDFNKVLMLSDIKKDIDTFPKGVQTLCGEKGISLSGGQKQRIGIARALLKNSDVLILDDVMSAVDAQTEKNIINNIRDYRKSKTTIIISHRLSQVEHCDEIIVLDDGKIIERGTHKELLKLNGWYKKQYITQGVGRLK